MMIPRRLARRRLAAVIVGLGSLSAFPTPAKANTTILTPTAEGWYQAATGCATPIGCVSAPGVPSPYPAKTLHVGAVAGQESARSYLKLPFGDVSGRITTGSLTVELDPSPSSGSLLPEVAAVQVCLAFGEIEAVEGSTDTPPPVDCDAGVVATYSGTPTPRLQADLRPLINGLTSAAGLALVPVTGDGADPLSWRIVFSAHDRGDDAATQPAEVALSADVADAADGDDGTGGEIQFDPAEDAGFGVDLPDSPLTLPPLPANAPQQPPVSNSAPTSLAGSGPLEPVTGYLYPAALLLPLAFLVLIPLTGNALTRDLAPAKKTDAPRTD